MVQQLHVPLATNIPLLERLRGKKVGIFDVDGTLVRPPREGAVFLEEGESYVYLPHVYETIRYIQDTLGIVRLFTATNQGGVAMGYRKEEHVYGQLCRFMVELGLHPLVCFHLPYAKIARYKADCLCRKPKPGMLVSAIVQAQATPAQAFMVGDMGKTDKAAADALGVEFFWAWEFFGWEKPDDAEADVSAV